MTISQLSVFAENKAGAICDMTDALAANGIDIRAFNVAETRDFGVLRLIVDDAEKAKEALSKMNCVVSVTQVIGVVIPDTPGGLAAVLKALSSGGINVEYIYAFISVSGEHACVVIRVDDNAAAEALLTNAGLQLLSDEMVKEL